MSGDIFFEYYARYVIPVLETGVMFLAFYWLLLSLERISAAVKLKGLAVAVAVIALAALFARFARMHAISWVMENVISFTAIILAIVFQPEVRRLFTRMGGLLPSHQSGNSEEATEQIIEAVEYMSHRRIGALIVIERGDHLDNYINSSPFDCQLTGKALISVFWKDAPLHDGAVIIRGGRIAAAGVILPLTENFEYKGLSGTRHRAGIGISEDTDAFAVLVSEETGTISVADKGRLQSNLTTEDLELLLVRIFGMRLRRKADL